MSSGSPSIEQVSVFYFNAVGFPLLNGSHPNQVYIWLCNSAPSFTAFLDGMLSLSSASLNVSLASRFILMSYLVSNFLKVLF